MPLSTEQQKIVEHRGSPLRVLAGPGTGKTHTMAYRIKHLIEVCKVKPEQIYAITFTNAAAQGMRTKLLEAGVQSDRLPYVSTLHSLAMKLIKEHGTVLHLHPGFRLLDTRKLAERVVLKDVIADLAVVGIKIGFQTSEKISPYLNAFRQECSGLTPPAWINESSTRNHWYGQFRSKYQEMLCFYRSLDWFMVIECAVMLLKDHADIRSAMHERILHLLVDEYQDLNCCEQTFVKLIVADQNNLCIVGDDDQSIYQSFRYAQPKGIIDLHKDFGGLTSLSLSECRRCPQTIIEKALNLISHNVERVQDKSLVAHDPTRVGNLHVLRYPSAKKEAEALVSIMSRLIASGSQPKDILVLFSEGDLANDLIAELKSVGIPIVVQLTTRGPFDTECFSQIYETLKFISDENDNLALRQCLDYWPNIGDKTVQQIRSVAASGLDSLWHAVAGISANQDAFKHIVHRKSIHLFHQYIGALRNESTFSKVIDVITKVLNQCEPDLGAKILKEFLDNLPGDIISLKEGLDQFDEERRSGGFEGEEQKGVRIMTMHSSKGLESDIVFVPALEQDIFPGESGLLEEKRRLFYVSVTRAKRRLFLSWSSQRTGAVVHKQPGRTVVHGKHKSRFINEMEKA